MELRTAVKSNQDDLVKLLLNHSDELPSALVNKILKIAHGRNYVSILELLFNHHSFSPEFYVDLLLGWKRLEMTPPIVVQTLLRSNKLNGVLLGKLYQVAHDKRLRLSMEMIEKHVIDNHSLLYDFLLNFPKVQPRYVSNWYVPPKIEHFAKVLPSKMMTEKLLLSLDIDTLIVALDKAPPTAITPRVWSAVGEKGYLYLLSKHTPKTPEVFFERSDVNPSILSMLKSKDLMSEEYIIHLSSKNGGPSDNVDSVLKWAVSTNSPLAKFMLCNNYGNPTVSDNYCLKVSSKKGHLELVKLLLLHPEVDPTAGKHYALRFAMAHKQKKVVEVLLQDPRIDPLIGLHSWD